ncbi:MAG: helix-turn-helix domain-containing protein, partial [Cyanobacteria bacterium REEB65]|nr:helix-turn-helix domain-containing protein [Cyanobacteria bacterium REEB65]
ELVPIPQGRLSEHLACLRWCHYVEARREGKRVIYRIADPRVLQILALAEGLAADHGDHVLACERIDGLSRTASASRE